MESGEHPMLRGGTTPGSCGQRDSVALRGAWGILHVSTPARCLTAHWTSTLAVSWASQT